jgi:hypothetical protein
LANRQIAFFIPEYPHGESIFTDSPTTMGAGFKDVLMSISLLLFFFVAAFLLACLIVLFALSNTPQARAWYLFFILSSVAWMWVLWTRPSWINLLTLFILPFLWLAGSLKASSPLTTGNIPQKRPDDEPRVTQEWLRGRAGTREALRLYFLLLAIALVLFLAFFASIARF